jgi:hypothetical protein
MKKTKKELEIRQRFLDVYSEFNKWLYSLGFRSANTKEGMGHLSYHYGHYDKHIDSLWSVENYLHDTLKLSIHFLRDRHEHKFMFVGEMGSFSSTYNIEQTKELILNDVRRLRDEELAKLSALASF